MYGDPRYLHVLTAPFPTRRSSELYGWREMDDVVEALVGFVGTHGDTLELLELAEEVFDQMTPLVHLGIERQGLGAAWMLGNDDLGAALVEVGDDGVDRKSVV